MKSLFSKTLCIAALISLGACASFETGIAKAQAWANSPQGQQLISGVESAVTIAAGLYDGGKYSSTANAAIQAGNLGLRSLETGTAPTVAEVQSAITSVGGSPKVAAQISPAISTAIQSAVSTGVQPNAAIEQVATVVDNASAANAVSGP